MSIIETLFGRKSQEANVRQPELSLLSDKVLKEIRRWTRPEVFPSGSPVAILTKLLREEGCEPYKQACTELLRVMRARFKVRPGHFVKVGVYSDATVGWMLYLEPSPRPDEDCIQESGGHIHPLRGNI
jgi:hypothetical protein